jgi:hypothetical protein
MENHSLHGKIKDRRSDLRNFYQYESESRSQALLSEYSNSGVA